MGTFRAFFLGSTILTLSACGGAPAEPVTPPPPPAPTAPAPAPAATAAEAPKPETAAAPEAPPAAPAHDIWKEGMTKDEQVAFMKKNVVPEMGPVFKGYDAKRYAEFSCKTCHGPKFKNPKEFLPKLTLKDGKLDIPADDAAIAKFMGEQVVPHMAAAMGLKPFDMATHTGFGCGGCHTMQSK
ncbi:MAG TPA: hypothetical protein VER96_28450 [Polyangiaceae bacterium]|nr:hypothetical protein [Polyangiaceae bacterium]